MDRARNQVAGHIYQLTHASRSAGARECRWSKGKINMKTDAKTIQCATEAGLQLVGVGKDRKPEYSGSATQWARYGQLIHWVEECNMFPWIYPFAYELADELNWPKKAASTTI